MKTYKVNNLEITESQVKKLAIEAGLIKEEKPLNRLYKHEKGALYTFTSNTSGFGFEHDEVWQECDHLVHLDQSCWKSATPEDQKQWERLLIQHAESKGFVIGAKINNENLFDHLDFPNEFTIKELPEIQNNGEVWVKTGSYSETIFSKGNWATIIEKVSVQDRFDELESDKSRLVVMSNALAYMSCNNGQSELDVIAQALHIDDYHKDEEFTAY